MIDTIIHIAKLLAATLPFVLLCLGAMKVNLPKPERSRQIFMPVVGVVYSVVAMFLVDSINRWLLNLIYSIPKWIASLAGFSWMPEQVSAVITQVANFLDQLWKRINFELWIFFIANAIIILAYMAVKRIAIAIMRKAVKTDGELHNKIAGLFYEYFPEKGIWCIKESYVQVRGMFRVFYFTALILSALLMMLSSFFYGEELLKSVFYPVFGIIVVGEFYFYLDGSTKREYTNDILGEDEEAYKTVNYSLLRKFLRSVFGDKLLSENTGINNALSYDITTDDILRELEKSEDPKEVSFATYYDALNKTGFRIDHNYLHSSLEMLRGKSILFNNPFYNDLVPYAFYPMNRTLLSHQKVLVVLGRHAIEEDIKGWIEKGIESVTNIPFMWNIGLLGDETQELDIGIVTRSDVLNMTMHNANADFLSNVGFVVVIEPSRLISTAQIGLNLLIKKCRADSDKDIVFCLCDKNCDGLIDAMSHVLMTNLTEVSATKKHLGTSSYMCWEADDEYLHHRLVPNISRYLGLGTELSFAALKNQVSKTRWFGGDAFPVLDMRWISKQYYYDLTRYAGLPTAQEAMDERFLPTQNFWSADVEQHSYMTVEDESFNMFEILRDFSTRTTEQGFINVISSDYLLKDYMADNASIFEADAKAVPYIVADYTRSNRNTILRLMLMMSTFAVSDRILEHELSLIGLHSFDLKKQLWYEIYRCYAPLKKLDELSLPERYEDAVAAVAGETLTIDKLEFDIDIIKVKDEFNLEKGVMETTYSITDRDFCRLFVSELQSAGYVSEDEKGKKHYLGAELKGHIYQKYLPGQFFTFGGKYYEMLYLTADGQVLVRRAADHINSRPSYRQCRRYTIEGTKTSERIGSSQDISGMKVVREFADISVATPGYYRMERYNDFTTARKVSFEGAQSGIPVRTYRNKEILRIELPDMDGKLTDNVRYTITVLFNEIFRTLFAENQDYITAITDDSFLGDGIRPLTYTIDGNGYEVNKNSIYIIEDSQLDLGLTVAVERNLERIFKIVHDYLDWHFETLENSLYPPPEPQPPVIFTNPEDGEKPKKKGFFGRIFAGIGRFFKGIGRGIKKVFRWIGGIFKKKPKDVPAEEPVPTDAPITPEDITPTPEDTVPAAEEIPTVEEPVAPEVVPEDETPVPEEIPAPEVTPEKPKKKGIFDWLKPKKRKKKEAEPAEEPIDIEPIPEPVDEVAEETTEEPAPADTENGEEGTDGNTQNGISKSPAETAEAPAEIEQTYEYEAENAEKHGFSTERRPYHERYYMLFGSENDVAAIDARATLDYLTALGMGRNPLKQARDGKNIADLIEATFTPGKPDARYCDFCGTEIYGVEYETLADGRDRCLTCGRTAIKTGEEFRKIFEDVKRNMESFFGIRIDAGIKVQMVNSKTLHKRLGMAFIPTPSSDGRVLGVAISDKNGYTLLVENGSPRMASMLTMAHELTHIWQYINWNDKRIRKKYGKKMRLEIYEGMAKWVEIQYAYLINEPAVAKREEIITSYRDDEYGHGFLRYRANYPFSLGTVITKPTPFLDKEEPLKPDYCGELTVRMPTDGINPGDIEGTGGTPRGGKPRRPVSPIKGPVDRTPGSVYRYAFELLSADEKAAYNRLLSAINAFEPTVSSFEAPITETQFQKVCDYILRDHPEIFWFRHGATFYFDTATGIVDHVDLKYCLDRAEAESRRQQIDAAVKSFMTAVTDTMSDYEVALRIYENIINLVDYDTLGLEKQQRLASNASPEQTDDLRSIYGVFVNKKAVCVGYAKATQYLLNLCGIECTYVTSDTHAWNLIKLEGDYYHLDTTWGDGTDTKRDKLQSTAVNYDCFCINDEELAALSAHTPVSDFPLPACTATGCNYHRRHGLYFEEYNFDRVRSIVCESVEFGKFDLSFKFADAASFAKAKRDLIDGGKLREAIQYSNLKSQTRLDTSFMYSANDERLTLAFTLKRI